MRKVITYLIVTIATLIIVGCGSTRQVTQLVREVQKDTVYLSNIQYDSIYISQDRVIERSPDTLYIKEVSLEYRYKLLRDTVRIVQRDSIPYEVTVIETREIKRPLTFFDKICRFSFTFLLFWALIYVGRFIKKVRN